MVQMGVSEVIVGQLTDAMLVDDGATIALALLPFTPAGVPIVAAATACLIGWRRP